MLSLETIKNKISVLKNTVVCKLKSLPTCVQISISDCCNYNCSACWIHGENVVADEQNFEACLFSDVAPQIMSMRLYTKILDEMKSFGWYPHIQLCGRGEPTVNSNFCNMILLAHDKGFDCSLVTNGSRLTFDRLQLLDPTRVKINVSLNAGDEETHRQFSGISGGDFTEIISVLQEYKSSCYQGIDFSLSFVINHHNISQFSQMADLAISCLRSGGQVSFYPAWIHPGNLTDGTTEGQIQTLLKEIPKVKRMLDSSDLSHNLEVFPYSLYAVNLSSEKEHPTRDYMAKNQCKIVNKFVTVLADGRVIPCCRSCYVVGNVENQSFEEAWNSSKAKQFRRAANNIKGSDRQLTSSHCFACDHLMGNNYFRKKYEFDVSKLMKKNL